VGELKAVLEEFKAPEWKTRAEAFYQLIRLGGGEWGNVAGAVKNVLHDYPDQSEQVKLALIRLLERENTQFGEYLRKHEDRGKFTDYQGDVINAVITLKDPRSMDALLGAFMTGFTAVLRALAEFAPLSLDPVLARLDDPDPTARITALEVLEDMIRPANYEKVKDPAYRSKIKHTFLRATSDHDPVVREVGVRGLAALGDTDVIPLLEKMACEDRGHYPRRTDSSWSDYYLVREAAKQALAKLRAKENRQR